jgi:hypothetical protein
VRLAPETVNSPGRAQSGFIRGERGCKAWYVFLEDYPAFLLFVVWYRRKGLVGRFFKCFCSRSSSQR